MNQAKNKIIQENIKLIILAGGKGTRLSEETLLIPKPMVKIGSNPIIWHIMKSFSHYGIREFITALGYKSDVIKNYFLNYKKSSGDITVDLKTGKTINHNSINEDWKIHLLETGKNTETGGRIKKAMYFAGEQRIMATYGDALADVNISELLDYHKSHGKLATLTAVRPPSRFGEVNISDGLVFDFKEKNQTGKGWINGGYFVLQPEVIDYIPSNKTPFERIPLERLAKEGQLMAYKHRGFWQPMDVIREKELLETLWKSENPPWKLW
tara:strand:+ start:2761 stop:3564 length:804 start_codon:yes stop_codon:yes gene_type:complete